MKIGDICSYASKSAIKAGEAVDGAEYMFFTSSSDENKRYSDYQIDGEGIIMGTGGNATLHYYSGKFAVSTDCVVLQPDKNVECKYLYYFFKANMKVLEAGFKGAGLKHTNKNYINDIEINVIPNIEEQKETIALFDKLQKIIDGRQAELKELDELIKARFVEMFGDPIANPMGWSTERLESACKIIVDCPHSTPNYTTENTGYMCIRTSIVKKNHILWDEIEYIFEEEFNKRIQRKQPEKGDVIYTREGAILGIAAIIDRECNVALGQRSMLLSPDTEKCTSEFLSYAMNCQSFLDNALRGQSGSASPHINVGDIKAFEMIIPPIEMQREFSAFTKQVDKSKAVVQAAHVITRNSHSRRKQKCRILNF
ncbi:hypothetical protein B6K86_09970 [Lachnospiraceae bacterium]|nr:hypothetical protein B6K86_09970 [Lachnospiraceae bacterium]